MFGPMTRGIILLKYHIVVRAHECLQCNAIARTHAHTLARCLQGSKQPCRFHAATHASLHPPLQLFSPLRYGGVGLCNPRTASVKPDTDGPQEGERKIEEYLSDSSCHPCPSRAERLANKKLASRAMRVDLNEKGVRVLVRESEPCASSRFAAGKSGLHSLRVAVFRLRESLSVCGLPAADGSQNPDSLLGNHTNRVPFCETAATVKTTCRPYRSLASRPSTRSYVTSPSRLPVYVSLSDAGHSPITKRLPSSSPTTDKLAIREARRALRPESANWHCAGRVWPRPLISRAILFFLVVGATGVRRRLSPPLSRLASPAKQKAILHACGAVETALQPVSCSNNAAPAPRGLQQEGWGEWRVEQRQINQWELISHDDLGHLAPHTPPFAILSTNAIAQGVLRTKSVQADRRYLKKQCNGFSNMSNEALVHLLRVPVVIFTFPGLAPKRGLSVGICHFQSPEVTLRVINSKATLYVKNLNRIRSKAFRKEAPSAMCPWAIWRANAIFLPVQPCAVPRTDHKTSALVPAQPITSSNTQANKDHACIKHPPPPGGGRNFSPCATACVPGRQRILLEITLFSAPKARVWRLVRPNETVGRFRSGEGRLQQSARVRRRDCVQWRAGLICGTLDWMLMFHSDRWRWSLTSIFMSRSCSCLQEIAIVNFETTFKSIIKSDLYYPCQKMHQHFCKFIFLMMRFKLTHVVNTIISKKMQERSIVILIATNIDHATFYNSHLYSGKERMDIISKGGTTLVGKQFLKGRNQLIQVFKQVSTRMQSDNYMVVIKFKKIQGGQHPGTYNAPTINEVSIVIADEQFEQRDRKILTNIDDTTLCNIQLYSGKEGMDNSCCALDLARTHNRETHSTIIREAFERQIYSNLQLCAEKNHSSKHTRHASIVRRFTIYTNILGIRRMNIISNMNKRKSNNSLGHGIRKGNEMAIAYTRGVPMRYHSHTAHAQVCRSASGPSSCCSRRGGGSRGRRKSRMTRSLRCGCWGAGIVKRDAGDDWVRVVPRLVE
ncbi:hypothetical protein PR048_024008 [Dryococelus australis]|uniref:Uncharacterized protein n=1 Tax=Dryococelus australis TaxID=614101 RepID=A0ABQ9GVU9_9NEOP|nr:hypothetical protein PR048_024008 [Dryococelus australis]